MTDSVNSFGGDTGVDADYRHPDDPYLSQEELDALAEILEIFENQTLRDTGMKWLNGGYAKAEMFNYDEDTVDIELEWGEQNVGDGRSVAHKECYTLERSIITADIDVMEKIANIKD